MLKHLVFIAFGLLPLYGIAQAVDVNTNVLGLVNAAPNVSVELSAAKHLGIEASAYYLIPTSRWLDFDYSGTGYRLETGLNFYTGKEAFEGFSVGAVIRHSSLQFSRVSRTNSRGRDDDTFTKARTVLGGTMAYKLYTESGFTAKFVGGVGVAVTDDYTRDDGIARFSRADGYRSLSLTARISLGWRIVKYTGVAEPNR